MVLEIWYWLRIRPLPTYLRNQVINQKPLKVRGTVDSITTNEINEFLTTFFKLYPTATASELSYYVNDGILKPIGKEYIFQELVNPYSQS